jgi:hypothetical protein
MALGCGLTSVRGNRGKNYENEPLVPQKHTKKKKKNFTKGISKYKYLKIPLFMQDDHRNTVYCWQFSL